MAQRFICPQCGVDYVSFSGLVARLYVRSNPEWVAPFTCGNSHTFFVPLGDAEADANSTEHGPGLTG